MKDIFQEYLIPLFATLLMGLFTYLGNLARTYIQEKRVEATVDKAVRFVEQVYKELHGAAKLTKAKELSRVYLARRGIVIEEDDLELLIESIVLGFNQGFGMVVEIGEENDSDE